MFTVRFPNGLSVQYNDANMLYYGEDSWEIYTALKENGGKWIASIQPSAGAVVEIVPPCDVYDALASQRLADRIDVLAKEIRLLKKKVGSHV